MPSLHVFNRRTLFAGDDLQPTIIINTLFRATQLFLLLLPVLLHSIYESRYFISTVRSHNGSNESLLYSYLFGAEVYPEACQQEAHYFPLLMCIYQVTTICHIFLGFVIEYIIFKIASVGNPTQPQMRNSLGKMVEMKWISLSLVGNFAVFALGAACFNYRVSYLDCHDIVAEYGYGGDGNDDGELNPDDYLTRLFGFRVWLIALVLLLASQIMGGVVSLVALGSLLRKEKAIAFISQNYYDMNTQGSSSFADDMPIFEHTLQGPSYNAHHHELVEEMWDNRCASFCKCAAFSSCYLFGGKELVDGAVGDYGQISRALADYFEDGGVLDLVPSDLAAGFFMLQRVQRQRVLEARRSITEEMKEGKGIDDIFRTSTSSIIGSDTHNFSSNCDDRQVVSALDDAIHSTVHTSTESGPTRDPLKGALEQGLDPHYSTGNMLTSVLYPMPYSRTLLLPDDTQNDFLFDRDNDGSNTSALMLRMIQDTDMRDSEHWYEAKKRKVFNRDDEVDRNLIAEGARFARHALSIYTWLLYFYMNPFGSIPRLLAGRAGECCRPEKKSEYFQDFDAHGERTSNFSFTTHGNTVGDNWLHFHRNALLAHSGLDETDLIYANFENKYNQMPYSIVIDHKWQSVVVSVRGTLSLEDCVVDVLVDPESLDEFGNEFGFDALGEYCHSGVLACVKVMMRDLQRHKILETLLSGVGAQYSQYKLRFTGHSLGAGCATLLGYIYRQKYPDLRVIAISPPGGFLSWRLATECNEFVTSFVLDSDLVPRLSVATMQQLRNEVLELFGRIKVPKMQVAKTFVFSGIRKRGEEADDPDEIAMEIASILYPKDDVPSQTDFHKQLKKFQEVQRQRKEMRGERQDVKLFPPGKLIHLVKTGESSSCVHSVAKCLTCCTSNAGYEYTPVWANNGDFNEIVVSPTMGFDHFPNRVCLELERVASSFGIDTTIGSSLHDREEGDRLRRNLF